ncbi:GSCOCG00005100001-RA-CDS [Cotesia congregata]|uniref:Similar to Gcc2: GRIP and coiled-coil domain-containing protein 2 (Mus musculus) n=1 Tax=Cotesia congregata TaxID=51543 RepID=A0A8J2HHF5_COTCN|nr:GSCOCG00005100001-RA-CDS [Cotesia congregata]CAG5101296.1 Similar to Gcc2: GRIP and coiled-coil domain-containing protein 2 (Mus musculus) [Cotesia congregata]
MEKVENETDNNKMTESVSNEQDTVKTEQKEDYEERYNKLRGFAVKLKKKVQDLTEELKVVENDKIKVIAEKEEFQKKISLVSDNVKKLQTIQLEYDKLQDCLEQEKNENKKLTKNLETLVIDNTKLKESNYEYRERISTLISDLDNNVKDLAEVRSVIKKNVGLILLLEEEKKAKTVICQQREKDYEEIKVKLEAEIQAHKNTKARLESAKQECSSNNVLFLEVDNYEKSIEDLKSKLADEASRCLSLESTIEEQNQTIITLEHQITELRDSCFAKTNQLTTLGNKNEGLKADLNDLKQEMASVVKEKQSLLDSIEGIKANMSKLTKESAAHAAEKNKIAEEMDLLNKNHAQQVELLKLEITRLNDIVSSTNGELEALKAEYEGYKVRAQSVLRTKQSQNKENGLNGKSINEIEAELNHLRGYSTHLQEKLDISSEEIKSLTNDLTAIKEERDCIRESNRDLGKKLSLLSQDYLSLKEKCRMQLTTIDQLKEEMDNIQETLKTTHSAELKSLETQYQQEIDSLKAEIQRLSVTPSINKNDKPDKFEHDYQTRNDIYLLEREDAEGSESVDSYQVGNSSSERNQRTLMPLDELLNSSDDYVKSVPDLPVKVDRQELEISERRVKHLTALLADAERDVAKLNQMNQLLKEDIRRQQRSVERESHANNFEYLKNIVIKFITLKNGDERSRLIPVLNTILKLSPEETHQLNQVAGVSGRGWLPLISMPMWNND